VRQDAELNLRLAKGGKRLRFTPDTNVVHHKRPTLRRLARQMYQYGAARAAIARKHRGSLRPVFVLPTLWVLGWLVLAIGSMFSSTIALIAAGCAALFVILGGLSPCSQAQGRSGCSWDR
jgi:GT2 family glycosyltransferase